MLYFLALAAIAVVSATGGFLTGRAVNPRYRSANELLLPGILTSIAAVVIVALLYVYATTIWPLWQSLGLTP